VGERVAGRAEPDDEHVLPVVRQCNWAPHVERIPSRQQRVDLETPRQEEDIGENSRLDLRDVDRLLLLEDAGAHAVVADAMSRARAHRVVDHHHRQRRDRQPFSAQQIHLADLLVERTALQRDA
jgi:hypothetical protein